MSRIDRATRAINRVSWLLWLLLISSLAASALLGLDPTPTDTHYGAGHVGLDVLSAVLLWLAAVMLVLVRVQSRAYGLLALGDWLQMMALSLAGVRMVTMLAVDGDAYISTTAVTALCLFAASSLCYSFGRLLRMGHR